MANIVKKLLTPLRRGREYIFPLTVGSQVKLDDDLTKTVDDVMVRKDLDVLTLEEIQASTDLNGKVPSAEAFSRLNSELETMFYRKTAVYKGTPISISAGHFATIPIDLAMDGYEPLIVIPKSTGHNDGVIVGYSFASASSFSVTIYSFFTQEYIPSVDVLYMRNS